MWYDLEPTKTTHEITEATWNQPYYIFFTKNNLLSVCQFYLNAPPIVCFGQI